MRFTNAALLAYLLRQSPLSPPTPSSAFSSFPKFSVFNQRRHSATAKTTSSNTSSSGPFDSKSIDNDSGHVGREGGTSPLYASKLDLDRDDADRDELAGPEDEKRVTVEEGEMSAGILGVASTQRHAIKVEH